MTVGCDEQVKLDRFVRASRDLSVCLPIDASLGPRCSFLSLSLSLSLLFTYFAGPQRNEKRSTPSKSVEAGPLSAHTIGLFVVVVNHDR
jgi:hypothetical protein